MAHSPLFLKFPMRRTRELFSLPSVMVVTVLCSSAGAALAGQLTTVNSVSKELKDGREDYVEIRTGNKLLKRIICESNQDSSKSCYTARLSAGGFLLIDYIHHDAVLENCVLSKYSEKGVRDEKFMTPFGGSYDELRQAQGRIASIDKVSESKAKRGYIEVTGMFKYKGLGDLPDCLRNLCIGDGCAGFDGYYSRAKITLDPNGNVDSIAVINKAKIPYSKQQIEQELRKTSSAERARECINEMK